MKFNSVSRLSFEKPEYYTYLCVFFYWGGEGGNVIVCLKQFTVPTKVDKIEIYIGVNIVLCLGLKKSQKIHIYVNKYLQIVTFDIIIDKNVEQTKFRFCNSFEQ